MKKIFYILSATSIIFAFNACSNSSKTETNETESAELSGQSGVVDSESQNDVVKVAVGSPDHTTLVTAVKAGELVDALSNAGPFTVFAPTNTAFNELPAGTVETLLKPENKSTLQDVLQHHVYVGVLKLDQLKDGMTLGMVDGNNVIVHHKDGKVFIDDAEIVGSVVATNGIVHVINKVVLAK